MKYYTQFLVHDLAGKVIEAMGSDGVFILDGRCGRDTMIQDSRKQMRKLKKVKPHYIGFALMKGDRFDNSTVVYTELL